MPRGDKPLSQWGVASGTYSFSMRMEEDAPPPLQMDATPFSPDFRACTKWITIRAPDILPQTNISRYYYLLLPIKVTIKFCIPYGTVI